MTTHLHDPETVSKIIELKKKERHEKDLKEFIDFVNDRLERGMIGIMTGTNIANKHMTFAKDNASLVKNIFDEKGWWIDLTEHEDERGFRASVLRWFPKGDRK